LYAAVISAEGFQVLGSSVNVIVWEILSVTGDESAVVEEEE
jgi:hypothetical protein